MRILLAIVALALAIAFSGCDPLSSAELKRQVTTVESIAAEGALLADQVADERTRDSFVRVHSAELAEEMNHTEAKLAETEQEGEVEDGLGPSVRKTIELAGDVGDALHQLELYPSDADKAAETSRLLRELSGGAADLSEAL